MMLLRKKPAKGTCLNTLMKFSIVASIGNQLGVDWNVEAAELNAVTITHQNGASMITPPANISRFPINPRKALSRCRRFSGAAELDSAPVLSLEIVGVGDSGIIVDPSSSDPKLDRCNYYDH